jgi:ankyrin repeat protein
MSFGFSVLDFISLINLAKKTCDDCRAAPVHFGEAGRGAQSIHVILSQIKSEVENPESVLRRDKQCEIRLSTITKNCQEVLKQLDGIVTKYKSLGTNKKRLSDRFRFPRKEILDIQGKLQLHETHLSTYLQTLGFGALGRLEAKAEENVDEILRALDRWGAELRSGQHPDSVLSDHTDDEKEFWKDLRRRLIGEGFNSKVMETHEKAIMERVHELKEYGLLESDAPVETSSEDDYWSDAPLRRGAYTQPEVNTDIESDAESEKTITPKASVAELGKSIDTKNEEKSGTPTPRPYSTGATGAGSSSTPTPNENLPRPSLSRSSPYTWTPCSSTISIPPSYTSLPPPSPKPAHKKSVKRPVLEEAPTSHAHPPTSPSTSPGRINTEKMPIWSGRTGGLKIKANFVCRRGEFVVLRDVDGEEILLPMSNLSSGDLKQLLTIEDEVSQRKSTLNQTTRPALDAKTGSSSERKSSVISDETEAVYRDKHTFSVGHRTHCKPFWKYRTIKRIPSRPSGYNCDALPVAAENGRYDEVLRLLNKGADIESRGAAGTEENPKPPQNTALYRAVGHGHFQVAKLLLDHGANPNPNSILNFVSSGGRLEMVRLLLEYGARPQWHTGRTRKGSKRAGATTALHSAAIPGHTQVVRLLLDYEADIDARDAKGQTPLYLAAWNRRYKVVKLLLQESADTDVIANGGQTALYKASGQGDEPIVRLLLRHSASVKIGRGFGGETTLYKASRCGNTDVVATLLEYGADPNTPNDTKILPTASKLDAVIWLLKPEEAAKNHYGLWPLHGAAEQGIHDIASMLLEDGARVDNKPPDGETALYTAARKKHTHIVKLLLASGAVMAPQEHIDPVMKLLDPQGSKVKKEDEKGLGEKSPLASAIGKYISSFDQGALEGRGSLLTGLGRVMKVAKDHEVLPSGLEDRLGNIAESYLEQTKRRFGLKS